MALVLDVLTAIDERSAAASARQLERQFEESGHEAGEKFGANLMTGLTAGFHSGDFDSLTGVLASSGMAAQAASHGSVIGAAFAGGIVAAASVALVDLGVKVGETFENVNRQITLHTAASGQALADLKSHADALVGSLDTATNNLGSDMATLATRLQMSAGPALDQLTQHVNMLQDRMGDFNAGALGGALANMGVTGKTADDTLASLAATVQRTNIPMSELVNNLAANSDLFKDMHLSVGEAANMLGEISAKGVPAATAVMGLQMGMKAAKEQGEDFNTFIRRIADSLDYYSKKGDEVSAEQLSLAVGGPRKWADLETAAHAYLDTVQQGAPAFQGQSQQLDDLGKQTRTLDNIWHEVKNSISAALAPPGLTVTDEIGQKMDELIAFINAHADDLRRFFEDGIGAIEHVVEAVGNLAALLGRHPALIEAVEVAFGTWTAIRGVDFVLTGLEAIGAWLVGAPAVATAAGVGVDAAMTGMAATTTAAGGEMALAFGPVMTELGAIPAEAEVAGAAITTSMTEADAAVLAFNASLTTVLGSLAAIGGSLASVLAAKQTIDSINPGVNEAAPPKDQRSLWDTVLSWMSGGEYDKHHPHPAAGGAPGHPGVPAGPGPTPTGVFAPGQGPGVTRAGPGLPDAAVSPDASLSGAAGVPAPADLITPGDFDPKKGGGKGPRLPQAPEVPYQAGYGAPPAPGETAAMYDAEQRVLEQRHNVDEARARLNQLEADGNAKQDDVQKARNDLIKAQREQNSAELQLYAEQRRQLGQHTSDMEQLGAKIDQDFGISKGLPGIADNLTKFLANLAAAPVYGALAGANAAIGGPTYGGKGLVGMAALGGAFGPQFTPAALAAGGAGGGRRGGGAGGLFAGLLGGAAGGAGAAGAAGIPQGYPSGDIAAAANRVLHNTGQVPLEAMPSEAAGIIASMFPQITDIGGTRMPGTAAPGTHEIGRTLDVMMPGGSSPEHTTPSDLQLGNQIYAWLGQHASDLGISSMIWQDAGHNFLGGRSGPPGSGWTGQPGHMNHIDVQFMPPGYRPPAGGPLQGPGATPGPPMVTDATGAVVNRSSGGPSDPDAAGFPGGPRGTDTIPAWLSPGEHVLSAQDVQAMGGQSAVYAFRQSLGYADGGQPQPPAPPLAPPPPQAPAGPQPPAAPQAPQPAAPQPAGVGVPQAPGGTSGGATQIGALGAPKGLGTGFTVTGGGLIGVAESIPSTLANMAIGAALASGASGAQYGGATEDLPHYYAAGGIVGYYDVGGEGGDPGGAAGGSGGVAGAPAGTGGASGATAAGISGPAGGSGTGAGGGGSPGGSVVSAAIGIGIQEMNEAISKGGQAAGALVGGVQQTFGLQQFAQTPLAQNGWINRIVGGIAGAQPQLPNMAGQHPGGTPEGVSGMGPQQPFDFLASPTGPPSGPTPAGAAGAPMTPSGYPVPANPASAVSGPGTPTPGSVVPQPPAAGHFSGGGDVSSSYTGVHIENYNANGTEDSAGQDIARHQQAAATVPGGTTPWGR